MVNWVFFLQSHGFYGGGNFGDVLNKLDNLGFFDFILPFLLIFAIVFGVLSKVKIFEDNKGVSGIIALSVGLMSLQFGFVSEFFSVLFPRVGIGIAVMLLLLIFLGFFGDDEEDGATKWIFWGGGIVIILVILADTFEESVLWSSTFFFGTTISEILVYAFIVALLSVVAFSGGDKGKRIRDRLRRRGDYRD